MTAPYTPADGVQARWRYAYDLVLTKQPGDDVTLQELAEILGLDWQADSQVLRSVMLEAKKHLEQDKLQTVRTVARFGWVVLSAAGNLDQVEKRRQKAGRATDRTARLITATDRGQLSPIERNRLDFETRNVLAAGALFRRKPKSFAELQRTESQRKIGPGTDA